MKHFKQRFRPIINKAKKKTYPGADIDLVLMSLTLKLKTARLKHPQIRFDLEKLEKSNVAEGFPCCL